LTTTSNKPTLKKVSHKSSIVIKGRICQRQRKNNHRFKSPPSLHPTTLGSKVSLILFISLLVFQRYPFHLLTRLC
ncbi:LOW QUALITY PROTEIN: hypothetical protein PanWU01x14_357130, partial [Parasponia andersonii]